MKQTTNTLFNLVKGGKFREAEESLQRLLKENSLNKFVLTTMLAGYSKMKDLSKSQKVFKIVENYNIEKDPKMINSYLACISKTGNTQLLIETFDKERHNTNSVSCYILLNHLIALNKYEDARQVFNDLKSTYDLDEQEFIKLLFISFANNPQDSNEYIVQITKYALENQLLNEISANYALRVCSFLNDYTLLFEVLEYIDDHKLKGDEELLKRAKFIFKDSEFEEFDWNSFYYQKIANNNNGRTSQSS